MSFKWNFISKLYQNCYLIKFDLTLNHFKVIFLRSLKFKKKKNFVKKLHFWGFNIKRPAIFFSCLYNHEKTYVFVTRKF